MSLTRTGSVMGTAAYMSPEQARGETADPRSDIFAFGVVLYELLSGQRAFARKSSLETMAAILHDEPAALDGPAAIVSIVNRCLKKSPDERFQTMGDLRAALEQPAPPPQKLPSIAVLPFANLSADKENEYFSDGLAEEILNLLARIPGLRVIARMSSFAFRGKEQAIATIAATLGVENVLEGSVRRAGNRIRVSAQLIQASDSTHLWSERYDREMTDIFALQDDIGQAISTALQVKLAPRARVVNVEAWEHWLKGVHYRSRTTPENVQKAKDQFEQALAIDPNYAQAYSGLALCHFVLANMGVGAPMEMKQQAILAAEKALALDPADSESYTVLASVAGVFEFDWNKAQTNFLKAIAVEHVSPRARYCYANYYLMAQGRVGDAIGQTRMALQVDPLSMLFHANLILFLSCARKHGEAIECARRALEIDRNYHVVWQTLAIAQLCANRPQDALASCVRMKELAPWMHVLPGCLAAAYHAAGDPARGKELAAEFTSLNFGSAIYYATAGDAERMFEALDATWQRRDMFLPTLPTIAFFDPYRPDPRYANLLRRMNLCEAAN